MEAQARTIDEPGTRPRDFRRVDRTSRSVSIASAGAVLVAFKAIACPLTLILLSLGAGTAWIGDLSAFAPYKPLFLALSAAQLGLGYYLIYRKSRKARLTSTTGEQPSPRSFAKLWLWSATAIVAAAVAFDYAAPTLFGIH